MDLALHYDFAGQGSLSPRNNQGPDLTCTRLSVGPTRDNAGWLREVQGDTPRFEGCVWNGNLGAYSNLFSNGIYVKLNATVAQNAVGRNGVANEAWTITGDGLGAGSPESCGLRSDAVTASTTEGHFFLSSYYVKSGVADWIYMFNSGLGSSHKAWFNVATGEIGTVAALIEDAGIEYAGNGYYRCWIAYEDLDDNNRTYLSATDDDGVDGWTNTVAQDLIYVQDFQIIDVSGSHKSQNFAFHSENFQDAVWAKSNIDAFGSGSVSNAIEPPRGFDNADFLRPSTNAGYARQSIAGIAEGQTVRWTIRVKEGGYAGCRLRALNVLDVPFVEFTFATRSFDDPSITSVKDIGDGWFEISLVVQKDSLGSAPLMYIYANEAGATIDGSSGLYVCGGQVEGNKPSQTTPGAYAKTNAVAVTNYYVTNFVETDADPVTFQSGPCEGIWVFEEQTNLAQWSEDFLNVAWGQTGIIFEGDQTIAPDGSLTADRLQDDGLGGTTSSQWSLQSVNLAADTNYCLSIFAKRDQLNWMQLGLVNFDDALADSVTYFDLENGVVGTPGSAVVDADIENWGNGWYRVWITYNTTTDLSGHIFVALAEADLDPSITKDGTNSIFVWGADCHIGDAPGPYIRSEGASQTHNADDVDNNTDTSWANFPQPHSWYVEARRLYNDKEGYAVGAYGSLTRLSQIGVNANGTSASIEVKESGGNSGLAFQNLIFPSPDFVRMAAGVDLNDLEFIADDGVPGIDTTVDLPTSVSRIYIGQEGGGRYWNDIIAEVRFYIGRLNREQLRKMTLPGTQQIFPGFDKKKQAKQKAIDAAIWNKAMNARTREARSESEEDYVPYNNIG